MLTHQECTDAITEYRAAYKALIYKRKPWKAEFISIRQAFSVCSDIAVDEVTLRWDDLHSGSSVEVRELLRGYASNIHGQLELELEPILRSVA